MMNTEAIILSNSRAYNKAESKKNAVWLQHTKTTRGKDRWVMTVFDHEVKTILDTGSSVLALKQIRRMRLAVPEVMTGPSCWDQEYAIKWG